MREYLPIFGLKSLLIREFYLVIGEMIYMVTKQLMKAARAALQKRNFVSARTLARLLEITPSQAGKALQKMSEWSRLGKFSWAREGYPL